MIDQRLFQKSEFLTHSRQILGEHPIDFSEKWQTITRANRSGDRQRAAGVLLLIHDRPILSPSDQPSSELVFQLIKRSNLVSQGGDISCPGGMLNPRTDCSLSLLTFSRLIPAFHGAARHYARRRSPDTFRLINLFLANAMRESWEEIRLSPFNVDFLGPLPTYSLLMFRRTIFPIVAFVKKPWQVKMNPEVDSIVEIPLKHFFEIGRYGCFMIESPPSVHGDEDDSRQFPCFVHEDTDGHQEILWGATFNIIMTFFKIVFNFSLPGISSAQRFSRMLTSEYITGRPGAP